MAGLTIGVQVPNTLSVSNSLTKVFYYDFTYVMNKRKRKKHEVGS